MAKNPHDILKAYGAIYNQSMLRDESASEEEKLQKRFKVRYLDSPTICAPFGHLYSVMVEELNIQEPNIAAFMGEMNTRIMNAGVGEACFKDSSNPFSSKSLRPLSRYLFEQVQDHKISGESAYRVFKAAAGDSDVPFVQSFKFSLESLTRT